MTKVDIFSGFLGAGKTTLIKKLVAEAYKGEQVVLIENEFGEIGIDGGFLKDCGVKINEMNSGCICCSLVGDFGRALEKVLKDFAPDRILIEPSGVGKLSDIISAVENLGLDEVKLNSFTTVVDAKKAKVYMKNFGEFYNNQVEYASSVILSHTKGMDQEKLEAVVNMLREKNEKATIITTDWDLLSGAQILEAVENRDTLQDALKYLEAHMDEDECDDPDCCCHHHDDDDDDEHEHHHHDGEECDDPDCCCHHHDDDDDDDEHEHHHHHHHHHDGEECDDPDCCCHHHDDDDDEHEHHHHHHHHHHADEVFDSVGIETTKKFDKEQLEKQLLELQNFTEYGQILRAKGIVEATDGSWIHFDYVPGEADVRTGAAGITGRLCIIGAGVQEDAVKELFGIK